MRRTARASAAAVVLTFSLAACGGGSESGSSSGNTSASASASATPSPSASPTEEPTAAESVAADSEIKAKPANGPRVAGDGYSYQAPAGWLKKDPSLSGGVADTLVMNSKVTDKFTSNLNVVKSPRGALSADEIEAAAKGELETVGATNIQLGRRVTVAGSESPRVTAVLSSQGVRARVDQYYLTTPNNSQTYVVSFSYAESVPQATRTRIEESVLASWKWS